MLIKHATGATGSTPQTPWVRERPLRQLGGQGEVRRDPFAMLPFSDYFNRWLKTIGPAPHVSSKLVQARHREPGFGEDMRILKRISSEHVGVGPASRAQSAGFRATRYAPARDVGLHATNVQRVYVDRLRPLALVSHEELFVILYDRLPKGLLCILEPILSNLWSSPERWDLAPECT